LALFFFSCLMASACQAQNHDVLCNEGTGDFRAEFHTGVAVRVGAVRNMELAARSCEGAVTWNDQNLWVATDAWQLDVDLFGADVGLGAPVAAFQVKNGKDDCCMEYKIYSLRQPAALLRTISGGSYFSAADTDLDGRVEIWTDDAAAVDGFEKLRLSDLDFAPPVVLRFTRGKLLDTSADFRSYFDEKIEKERAKLTPQDVADFKSSDGRLETAPPLPAEKRLRAAKMRVLEIVWSYLYSGREKEAWSSLAEMWPAADAERIRAALLNARARGIRSQLDGVSTPIASGKETHAKIFDGTTIVAATPGVTPKEAKIQPEIISPRAILMERLPPVTPAEVERSQTESLLKLVIDSAGKVRSVEEMGSPQAADEGLLRSTVNWKFIPAYSADEPVACRILLGVSVRR
jgi:hypothetical protein